MRHSVESCMKTANDRGGLFLSNKYINMHTIYKWQCKYGHVWGTSYIVIYRGNWCPTCAGNKRKSIEDCILLADKNEGKFLDTKYYNSKSLYQWQCKFGHLWKANYDSVSRGTWCPLCANNIKYNINNCLSLAQEKDGYCLDSIYTNANTKYKWQCKLGHIFEMKYGHVQQSHWCPKCNISIGQSNLIKIIKKLFDVKIFENYRGFDWLKTKQNMEIDIWVPELKLAIEYDGKQHFEPIDMFGGEEEFRIIQKRDEIKNKLITNKSDIIKYFIRFNYKENITEEYVLNKLLSFGVLK